MNIIITSRIINIQIVVGFLEFDICIRWITERSSKSNSKALPVVDIDDEETYTVGSSAVVATGVVVVVALVLIN